MSEYDKLIGTGERWGTDEDDVSEQDNSIESRLKRLEFQMYTVTFTQSLLMQELKQNGLITDKAADRIDKLVKDFAVNHFARPKTQN